MSKNGILAVCLCFVFVLSAFCFGVSAENESETQSTQFVEEGISSSAESTELSADGEISSETSDEELLAYTVSYGYKKVQASTGETPQNYVKGTAPASETVFAGGSHTVAKNTFTFRDYIFSGWSCTYTDASGESVTKYYSPGEVIYNIQSDLHLCATWRRQELDFEIYGVVSFDGAAEAEQNVCIGDVLTVPAPAAGYDAWISEGRIFYEGDAFYVSCLLTDFEPYRPDDDYLAGNVAKISYDLNGGSGKTQSEFVAVQGNGFKVDGCNAKKDGYNFVGWSLAEGSSLYREGDTYIPSSDMTFVAVWNKNSEVAATYYTVKISAGEGGSVSPYGQLSVKKGEVFEFNATADKHFKLSSVTYNGEELGVGGSYKMTVNGDASVKVVFESDGTYPSEDESSEESYEDLTSEEREESTASKEESDIPVIKDQTLDDSGTNEDAGMGPLGLILIILAVILVIGALVIFAVRASTKRR